jgi:hypothetical protein
MRNPIKQIRAFLQFCRTAREDTLAKRAAAAIRAEFSAGQPPRVLEKWRGNRSRSRRPACTYADRITVAVVATDSRGQRYAKHFDGHLAKLNPND